MSHQKGTEACSPDSLLLTYWKLKCVASQGGEKNRHVPWDPPHVMGIHSAKVPVILLTAPQFRPFRSKGYHWGNLRNTGLSVASCPMSPPVFWKSMRTERYLKSGHHGSVFYICSERNVFLNLPYLNNLYIWILPKGIFTVKIHTYTYTHTSHGRQACSGFWACK